MFETHFFTGIVDHPIDLDGLDQKLSNPDVGSQGWFYGVTRRTTSGKKTVSLSYQSHRAMADRHLRRLAEQAAEQFKLAGVVIVHRLGDVPVGEASVVVGCSSAHRSETFAALQWIMDTLKRDVPIWKREHFEDGASVWVHPEPVQAQQADSYAENQNTKERHL